MRPKTATPSTTYMEHFQDPKQKPKARLSRPKTVPKKIDDVARTSIQVSPLHHQQIDEVAGMLQLCPYNQQWNENDLFITANCVYVNVSTPNQIKFNIPDDHLAQKKSIKVTAPNAIKFVKKSVKKPDVHEEYWKTTKKVSKPDKTKGTGKLFEPPWGYKGHQPRPITVSSLNCCSNCQPKVSKDCLFENVK